MGKQLTGFIGLAAVMVLAIVVTLGVSTFTSTTSVQAKMAEGVDSEITPTGSLFSPKVAALAVTGTKATNGTYTAGDTLSSHMSNTDPGAAAKYTIEFVTSSSGALTAGTGTITLDWDDAFGIPATIATSNVIITSSVVTVGSGTAGIAVNPTDVTVTFIGVENDEPRIVLTVPDMDPADGTGGNGIGNSSNIMIIFNQSAGIPNPTEAQTPTLSVFTTADTTAFAGAEIKFTDVPF